MDGGMDDGGAIYSARTVVRARMVGGAINCAHINIPQILILKWIALHG